MGVIVFVSDETSFNPKILLSAQKMGTGVTTLWNRLDALIEQNGNSDSKSAVLNAFSSLTEEEHLVVKQTLGWRNVTALKQIIDTVGWDDSLDTSVIESIATVLANWKASPPWRTRRTTLPWASPFAEESQWETANRVLSEHAGLTLYEPSLQCVHVLRHKWNSGKVLFFVFRYSGSEEILAERLHTNANSRRWNVKLSSWDSARSDLSQHFPEQVRLFSKASQVLGFGGESFGDHHVAFLLSTLLPLFEGSHWALPHLRSSSFRLSNAFSLAIPLVSSDETTSRGTGTRLLCE